MTEIQYEKTGPLTRCPCCGTIVMRDYLSEYRVACDACERVHRAEAMAAYPNPDGVGSVRNWFRDRGVEARERDIVTPQRPDARVFGIIVNSPSVGAWCWYAADDGYKRYDSMMVAIRDIQDLPPLPEGDEYQVRDKQTGDVVYPHPMVIARRKAEVELVPITSSGLMSAQTIERLYLATKPVDRLARALFETDARIQELVGRVCRSEDRGPTARASLVVDQELTPRQVIDRAWERETSVRAECEARAKLVVDWMEARR
jgi:hypothetical protein